MTKIQVAQMIASLNKPYAYYQFPEGTAQDPPFICFFFDGADDMTADNTNYQKIEHLIIELYTDQKDFTLEATAESVLNASGLVYNKAEQFIDTEKLYLTVYDMDVVITEEQNG